TASSDFAFSAASLADMTETYAIQWRAVGFLLPMAGEIASTNAFTCGTLGWFQYHSMTHQPVCASFGTERTDSTSNSAPPSAISLAMPNCTNCFMQLIWAAPPMLFSRTFGLNAFALISDAEKSELAIGSMSPSNVPPSFLRFLTKFSCSVLP